MCLLSCLWVAATNELLRAATNELLRFNWRGVVMVACLSHLTVDNASLSRQSTVPTPNRDTSNVWALNTLFPCMYYTKTVCLSYPRPVSLSVATIYLLG